MMYIIHIFIYCQLNVIYVDVVYMYINYFQSSKHDERKLQQAALDAASSNIEKLEKKERREKSKTKALRNTDEEKELRKERKLGRKRVCYYFL